MKFEKLRKAEKKMEPEEVPPVNEKCIREKLTPRFIKEYLDKYIVGQDEAKRILSVGIYNHIRRVQMKEMKLDNSDELEKSNILMIGPSGTGKTALIKHLAKLLDIPLVIEDITGFSSAGFVGRDVETMLRDLVEAAGGNTKKASYGIIYIDEIDKCSRKGASASLTTDPGHEALQQALLKLIEGSIVTVPEKGSRLNPSGETFRMDTSDILFIVGGAFEGIEKIISGRRKKKGAGVGFGSEIEDDSNKSLGKLLKEVETDDFRNFGILPELLGRLPVICPLEPLTEEALLRILTEPRNSLVWQYKTLFEAGGTELIFSENALLQIAKASMEQKTGARSLRGIMEKALGRIMYEIPEEENVLSVTLEYSEEKGFYGSRKYCGGKDKD